MAKSARLIEAEKIIVALTFNPEKETLISTIRNAKAYREKYIDKKTQEIEVWVANNDLVLLIDDPVHGISPLKFTTSYFMRQTIVKDISSQLGSFIKPVDDIPFNIGQLFPGKRGSNDTTPRSFVAYGLNKERPFVKGINNYVWANKEGVNAFFKDDPFRLKAAKRALMFNGTMAR